MTPALLALARTHISREWILIGGAAVAIAILAVWLLKVAPYIMAGALTRATVVSIERVQLRTYRGKPIYSEYPIVSFHVEGQKYTAKADTAIAVSTYVIGQPVRVLYLPASPRRAVIVSFAELWLLPVVFLAMVVYLLCLWLRLV